MTSPSQKPVVGIIMGSRSDWPTMREAAFILDTLGVPHESKVVSAHRTPDRLVAYARSARERGLKVIKKIRCSVNPGDPECATKSEED